MNEITFTVAKIECTKTSVLFSGIDITHREASNGFYFEDSVISVPGFASTSASSIKWDQGHKFIYDIGSGEVPKVYIPYHEYRIASRGEPSNFESIQRCLKIEKDTSGITVDDCFNGEGLQYGIVAYKSAYSFMILDTYGQFIDPDKAFPNMVDPRSNFHLFPLAGNAYRDSLDKAKETIETSKEYFEEKGYKLTTCMILPSSSVMLVVL